MAKGEIRLCTRCPLTRHVASFGPIIKHVVKTIKHLATAAVFGFLVSCTMNPHPMDMSQAIQNAQTRSDHENLAKHYEDAAKEMQINVEQHRKLLTQYEAVKGFESRQYHNLIEHCRWLIRIYEQAVAENRSMAEAHRQIAAGN